MSAASSILRVVIDSNVFVSSVIRRTSRLLAEWQRGTFLLLMSPEQQEELEDVLRREEIYARYNIPQEERDELIVLLHVNTLKVPLGQQLPVRVRDPKDEMILATALAGNAEYIITRDEDLLELHQHPNLPAGLRIVGIEDFLAQLRARQED